MEAAYGRMLRESTEYSEINSNNTLYIGTMRASKSEGIISYYLRTSLNLPENNFIVLKEIKNYITEKINNIVLVDDIIGTGKSLSSAVGYIKKYFQITEKSRIYILTLCGYNEGIERLKEKQAGVFCGINYYKKDTINDFDGIFYRGLSFEEANSMQTRLYKYNRKISSSKSGYGKIGGLLVFEYSTPNTTIPVLWANAKGWHNLFQRSKKMTSGIKRNDNDSSSNRPNYTD